MSNEREFLINRILNLAGFKKDGSFYTNDNLQESISHSALFPMPIEGKEEVNWKERCLAAEAFAEEMEEYTKFKRRNAKYMLWQKIKNNQ